MDIVIYIILGGIGFGLIGFLIGLALLRRASKESPSINHYKRIVDILTLRKLRKKGDISRQSDDLSKDPIKHYEKMRDKMTTRSKKVEVEEYSSPLSWIPGLIGGFVTIVIGVTLLPMVAEQVNTAKSMNVTGTEGMQFVLTAVPGFFAIALLGIVIAVIWNAFNSAGIGGGL